MTRQYHDTHGRLLFVSDGISQGRTFGTYTIKSSGSMRRVASRYLPLRDTADAAQADLDAHAERKGWTDHRCNERSRRSGGGGGK